MLKNNLKEIRVSQNVNQVDLAKAVGTSRKTISNIENGRHNTSGELCLRIAAYFNKSVESIFYMDAN